MKKVLIFVFLFSAILALNAESCYDQINPGMAQEELMEIAKNNGEIHQLDLFQWLDWNIIIGFKNDTMIYNSMAKFSLQDSVPDGGDELFKHQVDPETNEPVKLTYDKVIEIFGSEGEKLEVQKAYILITDDGDKIFIETKDGKVKGKTRL
ncbi:MAG: hypothetical protein ACLFSQ_05085 [Candidatus Zixiibacteriota bacterium]